MRPHSRTRRHPASRHRSGGGGHSVERQPRLGEAAARTAWARSSRARVRSKPSATSVSNSGGVAVRPVTATRIAMKRSPAFQPRASASPRRVASRPSWSKATSPPSAMAARAASESVQRRLAVPALRDEHGRVDRRLVDEEEADEIADRAEGRQALLDERDEVGDLVVARHPLDPTRLELGGEERTQPVDQLIGREAADPLAVEPLEPGPVEDGAAAAGRGRGRTGRPARRGRGSRPRCRSTSPGGRGS